MLPAARGDPEGRETGSRFTTEGILKLAPELPGGLPFLGHALDFHRNPTDLIQRGREQLGEIFSFVLAGKQITVLTGPEANEAFFRASDDQLSQREVYQFTVPIFGQGIVYDVPPEIMNEQIALLFPALRDQRLQAYAGFMKDEAEAYFDQWADEGEVDLLTVANELTTFIASRCLIGHEFRQNLSTEFAHLYHDLEGGLNVVAFFKHDLPLPRFKRRDRARVRMVELISRIIADRRASGTEGEDFLQTLMTARYKDGSTLSDDAITGLLLTLIFAGQHTSSVLATWTGVLLLKHPQYLPDVLAEQREVFNSQEHVSLDMLRRLGALERAIKEAERMHPPLVMLMRKVLRDFQFRDYCVPAGGLVMVSPSVSHRVPSVFHDPDTYDPNRFGPGREEDRKNNYSLIGFGGGRHRCIGLTFAQQQVKVIWSVLLQRFEMELAQPDYEPNYKTFVVGPKRPCMVRYRRRTEKLQ
jgi:sterol 14-demethylase